MAIYRRVRSNLMASPRALRAPEIISLQHVKYRGMRATLYQQKRDFTIIVFLLPRAAF